MRILGTQYYEPKKAFEIYLSGCNAPHCEGCHNKESWNFNIGTEYSTLYFLNHIKDKVKDEAFDPLIDNIFILGGEPLDQEVNSLGELIYDVSHLDKKIWLFTKYSIENIPPFVLSHCDYIKCGRYISHLKTNDNIQYGIKLATSNQRIYKKGVDF